MHVPMRRDERKDTNRHMMRWVRETFVQAKDTDQDLVNHQTNHQPTNLGGGRREATTTTCSPCGCREAWWESKRKSKLREKKKITGADNVRLMLSY